MSSKTKDSETKIINNDEHNSPNNSKLSRRDALKRIALQTIGISGLFAALPAVFSAAQSTATQGKLPENNANNNPGIAYYSYYCEDYYGYIYNQPGAPYQAYQGYWEKIYSSYCKSYYSFSKMDSIQNANYKSYAKADSLPYVNYFSYANKDSVEYSSYYSKR